MVRGKNTDADPVMSKHKLITLRVFFTTLLTPTAVIRCVYVPYGGIERTWKLPRSRFEAFRDRRVLEDSRRGTCRTKVFRVQDVSFRNKTRNEKEDDK